MKLSPTSNAASSAQPELALRLRQAATLYTRAACLLSSDAEVVHFTSHQGTPFFTKARTQPLSKLLKIARRDLLPLDPDSHSERIGAEFSRAFSLAVFLIESLSSKGQPKAGDLVRAAKRCREWAAFEDSVMGWHALEPVGEREPAHYTPFTRNGSWIYTMPYGISDVFKDEDAAKQHADRIREEDQLARETTERLRSKPQEQPEQEVAA